MVIKKHGISIGVERINDDFYITVKAIGRLTHDDYTFMTPVLEEAMKEVKQPRVKLFFDGTEFEGWEPRAAWDDFRLGMKHGNQFSKVAMVGNKKWEKLAAVVGSWFIKGEMEYFEDSSVALEWLLWDKQA